MALFAKKYCDLCGEKVNLLTRQKLSDGFLCSDCKKKLSYFSSDWDDRTIDDVKAHLAAREQNKRKFAALSVTRTAGPNGEICIDDRNGKFYFAFGKDYKENNPEVFDFNQLLDFWFVEEYRTLSDIDNDGIADKYENNTATGMNRNMNNFGGPGMMNPGMMGGMMNGMVQIPQNLQQYFRRTGSIGMNDNSPKELSTIELHIKVNHAYIKRDIIFDVASNCSDAPDLNRAFNMCYEIVQVLTAIKSGTAVNNNGYQQMNNNYAQQNNGNQQMNNNGYQQMNNNGYRQMNNNGYRQANNMNANMGGVRPFCPNCGTQNSAGSAFCPNCGTNLKQ